MSADRGFTVVELLVVIALVCFLSALLAPIFTQAREQAKRAACLSNLRNIALGAYSYAQDFRTHIPITRNQYDDDMRLYYPGYINDLRVFNCPSTLNYLNVLNDLRFNAVDKDRAKGTSYEYWAWCRLWPNHRRKVVDRFPHVMTILADIDNRERNCILDPTDNHGVKGGNALFLDFHAVWVEVPTGDLKKWNTIQAGWYDGYRHGKSQDVYPPN
jgi:prepilin-type N-terminal cleavage/methylation domain-containing protein